MRYRVFSKLSCEKCQNTWAVRDNQIEAESGKDAQEAFERKHCLCPECLQLGIKAAVTFDRPIYLERLLAVGLERS
jgi:hypothetical protein